MASISRSSAWNRFTLAGQQSRGLEGYCDMEFTVTKTGEVTDAVSAVSCSSSVFRNAARQRERWLKWKYKPRVVNGEPIDSPGRAGPSLTYKFED